MLRNAPTLLLLIMVASLTAACSSPSYDQKALEIAEAWSQNSVDAVTKEVADLVLDDSPALANLEVRYWPTRFRSDSIGTIPFRRATRTDGVPSPRRCKLPSTSTCLWSWTKR